MTSQNVINTRLILFWIFIMAALGLSAQSVISVKEETTDENETTARYEDFHDRYGKRCALVIFHNVEPDGYTFEASGLRSEQRFIKSSSGDKEKVFFVFVPEGTKSVRIKHRDPSIKSTDYTFDYAPLKSAQTYHVYLNPVFSASRTGQQYLSFVVSPQNAILEVEEDPVGQPGRFTPWPLDANGQARKLLRFNTYQYKISAPDHYATGGKVTVSNPTDVQIEQIRLKPRYGFLTIKPTSALNDAIIYIDAREAGRSSLSRYKLSSGSHTVKIDKPLYKMYEQTITIEDDKEYTLAPSLESNFEELNLSVPGDPQASIYIRQGTSDRLLSQGSWRGPLEPGDYLIIIKRAGHKDATKQITVRLGGTTDFPLPQPTPMYGSLDITSAPSGCTIMLNDKNMGTTPKVINNLLVGSYKVRLTRSGYQDWTKTVSVTENGITKVQGELTNMIKVVIDAPFVDNIYCNDRAINKTAKVHTVRRGSKITIESSRFDDGYNYLYRRKKTVTVNNPTTISHRIGKPLLHYREFYWDFGYTCSGYSAISTSLGFTINHFNMEFFGDYALGSNDVDVYRYPLDSEGDRTLAYASVDGALGVKIGYSFRIGTRFRITPQIGYKYLFSDGKDFGSEYDSSLSAMPISLRLNLQTGFRFGIFLTPEYQIPLGSKPHIADVCETANHWNNGFAIRAGFCLNF